jgi:hypothetical protein
MPVNPDKVPCSQPGCRAWAMRDSDPPLCSIHARRIFEPGPGKKVGAPDGNANSLFHGFYSGFLRDESGRPVQGVDATSLEGEIAITRVALHRILTMLAMGATTGEHRRPLSTADMARLVGLAFQGTRTIGRLLEIKAAIGAAESDPFSEMINRALDALSDQWGVDL